MTRNDIEQEISDLDVDVNDEDVEREHDWEGVMITCSNTMLSNMQA